MVKELILREVARDITALPGREHYGKHSITGAREMALKRMPVHCGYSCVDRIVHYPLVNTGVIGFG